MVFVDLAIISLKTCVIQSEHPIQEKISQLPSDENEVQSHFDSSQHKILILGEARGYTRGVQTQNIGEWKQHSEKI